MSNILLSVSKNYKKWYHGAAIINNLEGGGGQEGDILTPPAICKFIAAATSYVYSVLKAAHCLNYTNLNTGIKANLASCNVPSQCTLRWRWNIHQSLVRNLSNNNKINSISKSTFIVCLSCSCETRNELATLHIGPW